MLRGRWADLGVRLGTGLGLLVLGALCILGGGRLFHALVAVICGAMAWELVRMLDGDARRSPLLLALAMAGVVMAVPELPPGLGMPLMTAVPLLCLARMRRGGPLMAGFAAMIVLAGVGMVSLRDDLGMLWLSWLVAVVVVTDVAGYFAGRSIGGPKMWARVSPSKTWSGTLAGWAAAALVGLIYARLTQAGAGLAGLSVALSMASQLGDISESALKRRVGVKDSSALLPGHGGVLDRFDGMLGASVFLVISAPLTGMPPGVGP